MGIESFVETLDFVNKRKPSRLTDIEFNSTLKVSADKIKDIKIEYTPDSDELILKSEFVAKIDPSNKRDIEHFRARFDKSSRKKKAKSSSCHVCKSEFNLLSKEEIYSFFFHGESFQVLENLIS